MKIYIAQDSRGDIYISDTPPTVPVIRQNEMLFVDTGQKRHLIIDIEKYDHHWHSFWSRQLEEANG